MSFTQSFLAETAEILAALDAEQVERIATGLARVRDEQEGRLFILGVGGSAGPRQPCGQRLPQDLRHRGVRAHRQRLRADGPHQRRGLGHHVLGLARRARGSTPTTRCWSSRSAAATPRRTSPPTSSAPSSWPRSAAPRCSASSAATAAPRPSTPRRARSCPRCTPTASPRTPRASAPCCGTCWSPTPPCQDRHQVGVAHVTRTPGRVIVVGGAGFIGSHFVRRLLARDDVTAGHASTTTSPRAASGTSRADARRRPPRGRPRRRGRPARPGGRGRGHRHGHPPRVQPRHRGGRERPGHRLRPGHPADPPRRRGGPPGRGRRSCSTPRAAASTATSARSRRTRTTARWCRSRPTARASWPARRCSRRTPSCSADRSGPSASATSSARTRRTASASTSSGGCSPSPTHLDILGDGRQSKSYIHVDDVISAVLLAGELADTPFDAYNVATGDYVTVTEIAELAADVRRARPRLGGSSGTPAATGAGRATCRSCGSAPTRSARSAGSNELTGPEALRSSMSSMAEDARAGRFEE